MGVIIKHRGNFNNTERFLKGASRMNIRGKLDYYGREGVRALAAATPVDSGITAGSWSYEIKMNKNSFSLVWKNSNVVGGIPVVILIQYGHGTRDGGYIQGRDFINPAIQPIFDKISDEVRKELSGL
jgi:hypothetical protein